jgi:hypothetical protein
VTVRRGLFEALEREKKTSVFGGDRRELSVYSIHPQSDVHKTKVEALEYIVLHKGEILFFV